MAEQRAVNSKVPGSSPGGGAIGVNHPIRKIATVMSNRCPGRVKNLAYGARREEFYKLVTWLQNDPEMQA